MLERLKSLFHHIQGSPRLTEHLPEEQVAVCAILLEVAESDQDYDQNEHQVIVQQLQHYFSLGQAAVEALIATTQEERTHSADLWPFTRAIAAAYDPDRKREVLTMVWQVIFADGRLDPYEDQLARRLQTMLSVNQSVLIDAKQLAREAIAAAATAGGPGPASA